MRKMYSRISDYSKWKGLNFLRKALTKLFYDFTIELHQKKQRRIETEIVLKLQNKKRLQ